MSFGQLQFSFSKMLSPHCEKKMSAAGSSITFETLVMYVARCCSPLKETKEWLVAHG